jgi:hypothetical protein
MNLALPSLVIAASVTANFLSMFLEPFDARSQGISDTHAPKSSDSIDVYIPGAGFSGYFYTLGRLHSHEESSNPRPREYYCFSAGCLALVSSLFKVPIDSVIELAHSSRNRWVTGEISRYGVVEHFIDGLFSSTGEQNNCSTKSVQNATVDGDMLVDVDMEARPNHSGNARCILPEHDRNMQESLQRIHVITSTWGKRHAVTIQEPSGVNHLKELLIQTTWIPFVTGSSFGKRDDRNGAYHNDGAFAGLLGNLIPQSIHEMGLFLPHQYHHSLLLPWRFDLLSNNLNMRMSHDKAVHFWEEGLRRGL